MKINPLLSIIAIAVAGLVAGCGPAIEEPPVVPGHVSQDGTSLGRDATYFIRKWGNPVTAPSLNGTTSWSMPELHIRVEFEKGVAVTIQYSNPKDKTWTDAQINACLAANGTSWKPYGYDHSWFSAEGNIAEYVEGKDFGWMTVTAASRAKQAANKAAGIPEHGY
jgi:hypothetical protein